MKRVIYAYILAILAFTGGCIEPYEPAESSSTPDILVIDGSVNSTDQSAVVRITHSIPLESKDSARKESNAYVLIEESGGNAYQLHEMSPGLYTGSALPLDP